MREIRKEKIHFFLEDANLSPVASALFALPSSALRVQPYSHVQIIMQNILLYRSTQICTQIYLYEKNLFFTWVRLVVEPQWRAARCYSELRKCVW